ncbi:MAG: filamentous hemagglutinin N-terminal domain-containing protein, partial [Jannaschia sp.]
MTKRHAGNRASPAPPVLAGLLLSAATALAAQAQSPQDGVVQQGQATIRQDSAQSTISQTSRNAVIDWRGFDVGRDHAVIFDQPGADATTLNRVTGGPGSVIEGAIRAPGTVVIQNGAGVLFTPTARIDVGGLVATSQQVDTDHLFATGGFRIGGGEQAGARVVNEGDITIRQAGLAALVGSDVENAGSIVAPLGTVVLAAGTRTTIDLSGDGMFLVAVGNPEERAVRATQSGRIDVSGGHVVISAAGAARALDSVVNTSGVIRASSLTGRGGSVRLSSGRGGTTRVGGRVEARGAADGGSIWVLGKTVNVTTAAAIDASGARDGGEVRIGGDLRGLGGLLRAEDTTLAWGSEVRAEGGTGQGGLVVAWADGRTVFDGTIST